MTQMNTVSSNGLNAHDKSLNESQEEQNSMISQNQSRLLRDSYDSGNSAF
jgi:hypothetical protein